MFDENKNSNVIKFEDIKTRVKKHRKSNDYQLDDSAGLPTIENLLDNYKERLDRLKELENRKLQTMKETFIDELE